MILRPSPIAKDNNRKQKTCVPFRSSSSVPGKGVFQLTAIARLLVDGAEAIAMRSLVLGKLILDSL